MLISPSTPVSSSKVHRPCLKANFLSLHVTVWHSLLSATSEGKPRFILIGYQGVQFLAELLKFVGRIRHQYLQFQNLLQLIYGLLVFLGVHVVDVSKLPLKRGQALKVLNGYAIPFWFACFDRK